MTKIAILEPAAVDKLLVNIEKLNSRIDQLERAPEKPLTRKGAAKYLGCSVETVDRQWRHLRHVPKNGTPYWFASELEVYIKQQ